MNINKQFYLRWTIFFIFLISLFLSWGTVVRAESLYAPTPLPIVEKMLKVADIKKDDIVYDLGSGDGRLVIMASLIYECQSVGIEYDEKLVKKSQANINRNSKITELVKIKHEDMLKANFADATIILVYLMPDLLEKLKPKFADLEDGVTIIAHDKAIPGIAANDESTIKYKNVVHTVFVYTTPLQEIKCSGGT